MLSKALSAAVFGIDAYVALFLDELPEFQRNVLEVLRQPLEEGAVTISRAALSVTFRAVHGGGGDEPVSMRIFWGFFA